MSAAETGRAGEPCSVGWEAMLKWANGAPEAGCGEAFGDWSASSREMRSREARSRCLLPSGVTISLSSGASSSRVARADLTPDGVCTDPGSACGTGAHTLMCVPSQVPLHTRAEPLAILYCSHTLVTTATDKLWTNSGDGRGPASAEGPSLPSRVRGRVHRQNTMLMLCWELPCGDRLRRWAVQGWALPWRWAGLPLLCAQQCF